jgi:hypothetical protein
MGADEYWPQFVDSDCIDVDSAEYDDWQLLGKPECWCGLYGALPSPYQCDGDADWHTQGIGNKKVRIGTNDLALLIANWGYKGAEPDFDPCADLDHKAQGIGQHKTRVGTKDLQVLVNNWSKKDIDLPGDCPRAE